MASLIGVDDWTFTLSVLGKRRLMRAVPYLSIAWFSFSLGRSREEWQWRSAAMGMMTAGLYMVLRNDYDFASTFGLAINGVMMALSAMRAISDGVVRKKLLTMLSIIPFFFAAAVAQWTFGMANRRQMMINAYQDAYLGLSAVHKLQIEHKKSEGRYARTFDELVGDREKVEVDRLLSSVPNTFNTKNGLKATHYTLYLSTEEYSEDRYGKVYLLPEGIAPFVGESEYLAAAVGDPDEDGDPDVWTINKYHIIRHEVNDYGG